jgi:7-keto-8-aminopelargonate synthetase-like enzyme
VLSFASCSYLSLEQDPRVVTGAVEAVVRHGVSFSASRCFATSPLYAEVDRLLERLFGRPVVLAGSTTLAHGAALPILLAPDEPVLFDRQVHHSVQTALTALGPRPGKRQALPHNDMAALEVAVRAHIANGARKIWYCADGIYSMFGDRLPLAALRALMDRYPTLHAYIDDAHGMSWTGTNGAGSVLDAGLPRARTILATSLSKGFGCGGGVIAVPDRETKERIENLGPTLMFSIQVPPPILGAIAATARIHLSAEVGALQAELAERVRLCRALIAAEPLLHNALPIELVEPSPVQYLVIGDADRVIAAAGRLLARGFFVNPVAYPAVPRGQDGLRFTLNRAHTVEDVHALISALTEVMAEERRRPMAQRAA